VEVEVVLVVLDYQAVLVVVEEEMVEMLVEVEIPHQYHHHKEIMVELHHQEAS
jgi:hypothetical protein